MAVVRSPRAKMVYVEELDALVQEDLMPDLMEGFCSDKECEPPVEGKEDCEFYQDGIFDTPHR